MGNLIADCRSLLAAYEQGKLGHTAMPEDANHGFSDAVCRVELKVEEKK
jgi:hypothetical protein